MILDPLEQYEIRRRLPPSPFGERFEAVDRVQGHSVLLTRLPAQLVSQPSFEAHLLDIRQRVKGLRHGGLQLVEGSLRHRGNHYLVGEWVTGQTLAKVKGRALPEMTALGISAQIAEALDTLHRAHVVHGALHPAAVFVSRSAASPVTGQNGATKLKLALVDLCLPPLSARQMAGVPGLARELVPYLAPEQAAKGQATGASDIFSLGVLLYELLTGQLPFHPQGLSKGLAGYYQQKVRPVGDLRPELSPATTALIHQALALHPAERFVSARQMAQALRAVAGERVTRTKSQPETDGTAKVVANQVEPAPPRSPFAVFVEPKVVEITAGQQVVVNVTIRNRGADVDHATLQVLGLPRQWISMSQEFVRLVPGTEASLPVTITVPRDPSATAGRLPFQLKVNSTAQEDFVVSVPGTIVIHPFSRIRSDAAPLTLEHGSRLAVTVRNEGNVTETFRVEGGNADKSVQLNGEEDRLRLLAGATGVISLRVTAVSQPTFGDAETLPFSIRIWTNSGVDSVHSGLLEVPPVIPRWLVTVLAVLLLLATTAGVITAFSSLNQSEPTAIAVETTADASDALLLQPVVPEPVGENPTGESEETSSSTGTLVVTPVTEELDEPRQEGNAPQEMPEDGPEVTVTVAAVSGAGEQEVNGVAQATAENDTSGSAIATESAQPQRSNGGAANVPYVAYQIGDAADGSQIRLLRTDGRQDLLLVEDAAQPAWAPDGRRLAFVRSHFDGEGAERTYRGDVLNVVTENGTLLAPLTERLSGIGGLSWSPDGQQIAFHALPEANSSGRTQLFIANSDGSGVLNLAITGDDEAVSSSWPVWSPDGSELLFYGQQAPASGTVEPVGSLYVVGAGGGVARQVLDNQPLSIAEMGHSWSPDGSRILFAGEAGGELHLYTVRADGSELLQLPGAAADARLVRWSPDGTRILYLAHMEEEPDALITVSSDGNQVERLTEGVAVVDAQWSADGSHIVLAADPDADGQWALYQIPAQNPADGELIWELLSAQVGAVTALDWQP